MLMASWEWEDLKDSGAGTDTQRQTPAHVTRKGVDTGFWREDSAWFHVRRGQGDLQRRCGSEFDIHVVSTATHPWNSSTSFPAPLLDLGCSFLPRS